MMFILFKNVPNYYLNFDFCIRSFYPILIPYAYGQLIIWEVELSFKLDTLTLPLQIDTSALFQTHILGLLVKKNKWKKEYMH